jgi:hypothetical protein
MQGLPILRTSAALLWLVPTLLVSGIRMSSASEGTPAIEISSPAENAEVVGPVNLIEVSGVASPGPFTRQDLVLVLDVSGSTLLPSGVDVNGNGRVGRLTSPAWFFPTLTDPGDSVRAAEFFAAHRLLDAVDSRRTRVGLVVFEGRVRKSLAVSTPREEVEAALEHFQRMGTELGGATNFAEALRAALAGLEVTHPGTEEVPRAHHVLFLSDGLPTAPPPPKRAGEEALAAAAALRDAGADIQSFALGTAELEGADLTVYSKMAELTGGSLTRLPHPADVVAHLPRIDLVGITAVEVTNQATGEPARALRLGPDGSFDGFVALAPGENRIQVQVHDREKRSATRDRLVVYSLREPKDPDEARRFDEQGKVLLERLRTRTVEAELVHQIEQTRSGDSAQGRELELRTSPEKETPADAP